MSLLLRCHYETFYFMSFYYFESFTVRRFSAFSHQCQNEDDLESEASNNDVESTSCGEDQIDGKNDNQDSADSIEDEEGEDHYDQFDDNDEIWKELYDDASTLNEDILSIVISYIRICHALQYDSVYQSVMETVKYAMDINHEKNFDETLDFAIQLRKFLILITSQKAREIAYKDGKEWAMQEEQ